MAEDKLNRREFMSLSTLTTLGAVSQQVLGQPLLQTPTPSPTPTATPLPVPVRPTKPEVIDFVADDLATRGSTFLRLRWTTTPLTDSYEVRVSRAGIDVIKPFPTNESLIGDLLPNQDYVISVRGLNSSGPSEWSPTLAVCTRLAKPPPPIQAANEMTRGGTEMILLWDLSSTSFPAGVTVKLEKRRVGASFSVLTQATDLRGQFLDNTYVEEDLYSVTATVANALAPGGVNRSERSEEIRPFRMVFAELRIPGEIEVRQIVTGYLRDYYA